MSRGLDGRLARLEVAYQRQLKAEADARAELERRAAMAQEMAAERGITVDELLDQAKAEAEAIRRLPLRERLQILEDIRGELTEAEYRQARDWLSNPEPPHSHSPSFNRQKP